ncbi:hypothetical protein CFP56_012476 [Quercus suber]|uniref:Uncharacterized protein n=1 Tax=Quercus suber TaxID=58331 RepID=A0AAW0KXW9_QUESU
MELQHLKLMTHIFYKILFAVIKWYARFYLKYSTVHVGGSRLLAPFGNLTQDTKNATAHALARKPEANDHFIQFGSLPQEIMNLDNL